MSREPDLSRGHILGGQKPQGGVIEIAPLPPGFITKIITAYGEFYAESLHIMAPGLAFVPEAFSAKDSRVVLHRNVFLVTVPFLSSGAVAPPWWEDRHKQAVNQS